MYLSTQLCRERSFTTQTTTIPCRFHLTGTCTKGDACVYSHSGILEPFQSSSQHEWTRVDEVHSNSPAAKEDAHSQRCQLYANGKCARGDECPFAHEDVGWKSVIQTNGDSSDVCKLHLLGRCSRGIACPFRHESVSAQPPTSAGRVPLGFCQFYNSGKCARGNECPFRHNQVKSNPSFNNVSSQSGDVFRHGNSVRRAFQYSPVKAGSAKSLLSDHRSHNDRHVTSPGVVIETTLREPIVGPRPDESNDQPLSSSRHIAADRRLGEPQPASKWETDHAVNTPENHVGDTWSPWNKHTRPTWEPENPPSEKREDSISGPKNCKFFAQGDCVFGAACPDLHDDPAWFATNVGTCTLPIVLASRLTVLVAGTSKRMGYQSSGFSLTRPTCDGCGACESPTCISGKSSNPLFRLVVQSPSSRLNGPCSTPLSSSVKVPP
jgi:hypothetical protein